MSNALEARNKIHRLEDFLLSMPEDEKVDIDAMTFHHFAPGVYAREMKIPKGVVVTGKIHKTTHLSIVSQGKISIATEEGNKIIEAPAIFVTKPGTKRAAYALEDTTFITIHVTEETDLDKIEQLVIAKDYNELTYDAPKEIAQ
jgi:quercetin dioxygenase-like cupin family protein